MRTVIQLFAGNNVFANIAIVLIFLAGGIAAFSMVKETFPSMEMDRISVTVPYPGADPEEVEEGVTRKIEDALESLSGIREYTTRSSEGVASADIEVKEGYDTDEVLDEVKANITAISTFPVDAENPVVKEILMRDSVVTVYLASDMPERRLKKWGERIRDRIKQLPEVSQADLSGTRAYEISIEISEERLRQYGLTFSAVAEAVRKSSVNLAGGTLRTEGEEIRIRTEGRKYTGEALGRVVVKALPSGEQVRLDRIARIVDGFEEDPSRALVNGKPAVLVTAYKTEEEDALVISRAVHRFIEQTRHEFPPEIQLEVLYDRTDMLKSRINLLLKNGAFGLCIVFVLLWAFLNTRLSFWVGLGIPVSISGALITLWAIGGTINMISLFGLILVVGIVVDDAIVVGESIYVRRKEGVPPFRAAVDGTLEIGMPVVAAVTTSVAAFIPLAFVGGNMGKFIAILPPVVISCLLFSLFECFFLLPAHLNHLPPVAPGRKEKKIVRLFSKVHAFTSQGMEWFVAAVYTPFLSKSLRWRYISLAVAVSLLMITVGIIRGGIVKFNVFPEIDGFVVTSSVTFPNGTPAPVTRKALARIEHAMKRLGKTTETKSGDPLVTDILTFTGTTSGRRAASGPHAGMVQAILLESEKRGIHSKDILVRWEKLTGPIPGAESVTFESTGPGHGGPPLAFELRGERMETLLSASEKLMDRLKEFEGVFQVQSDFSPGKTELRLKLRPAARSLGITVSGLASQVNAAFYGIEAQRIQRGEHDIRVKVRYTEKERSSMDAFRNMRIHTPSGAEVPLHTVAEVTSAPGYATITRTNGRRSVTVTASVDTQKANANEIFNTLSGGFIKKMKSGAPDLTVVLKGNKKRSRESFSSLKVGFPIALVGIFAIVATMFRSYIQPVIIMFTIPFGVIGAVFGHLAMGYSLSIMSVFGMVALTGVVVNDAIVLIERINENIAGGMGFFEAVLKGGARRFRAVFLTTLSTIGGLAPMLMETDLQARVLIPMAISLAAGVAFATLITLVLVPGMLAVLSDIRVVLCRLNKGYWPERVEVEPGRHRRRIPGTAAPAETGDLESVP